MSLLIPVETVRDATKAEIRNVTGLDLVLRGDVAVSLFPTGSISFANVTLGDDTKPVLAADRLTARLRFFPLFAGRIEIADVSLVRPHINVNFDRDGHSNWAALIDALARALGPKANRPVNATSFTEIRINDGTIAVQDPTRGINETFKDVELALAWPSISKSFAATGRFVWHDEPVDATITLADFAAALAGDRSGLKVRLTGAPLKFAFEGNWSTQPTLEDRRHARRRRALAARHVPLGRPQAAVGRRLRPLRAQGQDQRLERHDRAVHGQRRARRQRRRGRARLRHRRPADPAGHARRRRARPDALCLAPSALLTNNERDWNRVPLAIDGLTGCRSRPAAVGGAHHARPRQARAHRHRRQPARRQAAA